MKKIVFLIIVSFLLVFTGCNDDEGYSLDNVWIGLGIVESTDSYRIVLDNGKVLIPVAYGSYYPGYGHDYSGNHQEIKAGDRVLVNFTILDDEANEEGEIVKYYVRLNSAKKVLMKGILDITPENQDSIGNDPIVVQEYWISNNLLNLELKYWGKNEIHFINLIKQPGELTATGQPFELEIRHNANDDDESIPYIALVSFKLDSLQVAGIDSIRFKVKSTDYEGDLHEFDGVYKYGENN